MLQSLHIKNYALIESLDIGFHKGFSVITGETGAGKSILLGAISLLLGERADAKVLKPGAKRCVIEAVFDLSDYNLTAFFEENGLDFDGRECIIRRELGDTGKSRAFINDTPISVSALKELGTQLVDIHSQHQNLLLNDKKFQLNVLDTVAGNKDLVSRYHSCFATLLETSRRLKEFEEDNRKRQQQNDFVTFQTNELKSAKLISGEQEKLEEEAQMLNNAEIIKEGLFRAENLLAEEERGITSKLSECTHILEKLSKVYPKVSELVERMASCSIELNDIGQEISDRLYNINFDSDRQTFVNERLDLLNSLQNKYHKQDTEELIELLQQLNSETEKLADSSETLKKLHAECAEMEQETSRLSQQLSESRQKTIDKVEQSILERLQTLGIPNVKFEIQLKKLPAPTMEGIDDVRFLFSANKDMPLQDIATVGSGGEVARVMLSLKALLSTDKQLRTLIFDEIDTGVSGRIAEKMAYMMKEIAGNGHQVISITHLPQIASLGEFHYLVYKEEADGSTHTHIRELQPQERINEIAHMLSGEKITEAAINNAKSLLKEQ